MPTDPLTGSRYPSSSAAPNVAQDIQNAVIDLADNTVPRFASTAARDTAYTAMVSGGGTMADGMMCTCAGVPYRRINGTWRIDRNRNIVRPAVLGSGSGSIISGGSTETGTTAGASLTGGATFTLYEAGSIFISGQFRAGGAGAALCSVKVDGTQVGNTAVSRSDGTVSTVGVVALAAGTHTVSARVDASGGAVTWTDGIVVIVEGIAE